MVERRTRNAQVAGSSPALGSIFKKLDEARQCILYMRQVFEKVAPDELKKVPQEAVCRTPEFQRAKVVALYSATRGEVPTNFILQKAVEMGKTVVFPSVREDGCMDFITFTGRWKVGKFKILEPEGGVKVSPDEIELFVVPGIIFDIWGGRIGFGKGFYDRVLARVSAPKFALAWSFQVFSKVPQSQHDVKMDKIFTEKFLAYSGKVEHFE